MPSAATLSSAARGPATSPPSRPTPEWGPARCALARGGGLVVTYGNGPQVGAQALRAEATVRHIPLHVLDAQSQGHIGHLLQVELALAVGDRGACTVLTHVEVDPADHAFGAPSKPIGAVLEDTPARPLAAERAWIVARDGPHWRRVVGQPGRHPSDRRSQVL